MARIIINGQSRHVPGGRILLSIACIMIGVILIGPFHEFGHCVFYWIQGIPASMSLTKEFPLRDITVREYALGSFGGIFFSWLALLFFFVLQDWLLRKNKKGKEKFSFLFLGQNMIGFISLLQFFLKGDSPGEFRFAETQIGLPKHSLLWLTVLLSLILLILFLSRLRIRIRLKEISFFFSIFVLSLLCVGLIEELDKNLFWHKFPTIKIGDVKVYNAPLQK